MRLGVGFKLGLWLAAFGILSAGLTGYYAYTKSRDMLIAAEEDKLVTATDVLARRFTNTLGQITQDVRMVAALPSVRHIAGDSGGGSPEIEKRRLSEVFRSLLLAHREYFQLRFIGADDFGRELVRVDRDRDGLTDVTGRDLQEKAHFAYVFETLRLRPGQFYFSHININREQGAHEGMNKPTLHIATPIAAGAGRVFGIIVVNVDLNGLFELIRADLPPHIRVYFTNRNGDYLIHPDGSKTFGFDQGRSFRLQDELDGTAALWNGKLDRVVLDTTRAPAFGPPSVATFVKVPFGTAGAERFVVLGLATPLDDVLRQSRVLGLNILEIILALSLIALLLALALSRLLTRPLQAMARAVGRFSAGDVITGLPLHRRDEIGALAQNFHAMASKLNAQVGEIEDRKLHLNHLAHHDQLTGLPNRLLFLDRLKQGMHKAARNRERLALLFIDLDRFKHINDSLGHLVGDEVLKAVAGRLLEHVRKEDTISRLGGDEFTIVLEELHTPDDATVIAQKLIALFKEPFVVGGNEFYLSCSIGISIYPDNGMQAEDLLRNADAAMYRAKEQGRNTFQFYTEDMTARALQHVLMETGLRRAIEQQEFRLHYQPLVELATSRIVGLEALVRWNHPELGAVAPAEFIPLAEETGLIVPLSEWILAAACRQAAAWFGAGLNPGRVAVNLSGNQLRQAELIDVVTRTLRETGCRPQWLELEVSEGFVMKESERALALLTQLRALGIELAIDDFGTGYSSLSYLKRLPISKLKIDQSFVRDLPQDADDAAIARAVIALARSMKLKVTAEGVETAEQRAFLRQEGCDEAQGFFYARPMPAEAIGALLRQGALPDAQPDLHRAGLR
jgi:diguanylate cyclase (GGDEF)-like protein